MLNLQTGHIGVLYNLLFDDKFETVKGISELQSDNIPSFILQQANNVKLQLPNKSLIPQPSTVSQPAAPIIRTRYGRQINLPAKYAYFTNGDIFTENAAAHTLFAFFNDLEEHFWTRMTQQSNRF